MLAEATVDRSRRAPRRSGPGEPDPDPIEVRWSAGWWSPSHCSLLIRAGPARRGDRLALEVGQKRNDLLVEVLPQRIGDGFGRWKLLRQRVDEVAAALQGEVQMRAGGQPGVPGEGDNLLLLDPDTGPNARREAGEVEVAALHAVEVPQAEVPAGALVAARACHQAVRHRPHRRADRRAIVDSVVCLDVLEHRMETAAEPRGDIGVLEWAFQKSLASCPSVLLKVGDLAAGKLVAEGALSPNALPLIDGGQNL